MTYTDKNIPWTFISRPFILLLGIEDTRSHLTGAAMLNF